MLKKLLLAAVCLPALQAMAQAVPAAPGPYAGEQARAIKALSAGDMADLMAGQGMGLAKAAELNGYPGPAHVLEHADALALTHEQRHATRMLLDEHKARARRMGAALVEAERKLDEAFASRRIDAAALSRLTAEIGTLQAQLREEHLRTHLAQTALLSADQVRRYAVLRGYGAVAAGGHAQPQGSDAAPAHQQHQHHQQHH